MKNLLIICMAIIPLFLTNCKKVNNGNTVIVQSNLDISYKDKMGNDLLNPSFQNYFSPSNIHIYSLVNGVKNSINNARMEYPQDYMIYKNDSLNLYFLRVFLASDTLLLQLNQSITDTLTCIIDDSNGNVILKKAWYNGTLIWGGGYPTVTIVK